MSENPSVDEVRRLLSGIIEFRDVHKIAYAASCSSEFEQALSSLIGDAEQQLHHLNVMANSELRKVKEQFQLRLHELVRSGLSKYELAQNSRLLNADLCDVEHRRIVSGRCPWCGQYVTSGKLKVKPSDPISDC